MITLYGIKNCDTIKKARRCLEQQALAYQFHDYRTDGLDAELLARFAVELGWKNLLNTRGTTWRKLADSSKAEINETRALALMLEQPALIKRPVLQHNEQLLLGFDEQAYLALSASSEK
ncbi:ArsC family reductase [Rheinheimera sp. UJ63]|uniref:ArsC family reductase n=1 Tax=Rheinheimera sp. UJ63 TaxID=2910157 RepID=UPI001F3968E4|nr:ArsC family reductase [Rheinheimera sp. UJ63]MCF4009754.1 ArsC family reductase [Rheinheimera sp. UJ63]